MKLSGNYQLLFIECFPADIIRKSFIVQKPNAQVDFLQNESTRLIAR